MNRLRENTPPPSQQNTPGQPDKPQSQLSGRRWVGLLAFVILFNIVFYALQLGATTSKSPQVSLSYSTFVNQAKAGNIKQASLSTSSVDGTFKHPYRDSKGKTYTRYTTTITTEVIGNLVPFLQRSGADVTLQSSASPVWLTLLTVLLQGLPFLLLVALLYFGSRSAMRQQQGIFGFGQSRVKVYTEERPSTTFADVAGADPAKAELREIIDFLRDPDRYHRLGARIPKGVLLVGPPGTGKTLMARAVAGEARVPFFSISASEFIELFVGVGASRVRDLFERAKAAAPSIVFVDEIDAVGGSRSGRGAFGGGSNDEREQTLNQLLTSMDGFEPNEAVIVMAATNRPDVLDPALLRAGRFDRQVVIDPPDRKGREEILKIHCKGIPLAADVDLGAIARATAGMSGADLANLANEAALTAARKNETQVTQTDFLQALDRITLGLEGSPLMDEDERRTVAYHEGGHGLVAYVLPHVDPVNRITITPRGRSLGVTQFLPAADDRRNYKRSYLLNRMAVGLGGRAAEEIARDDISSGAQNDLQQVTNIARAMVTQLGMSEELGPIYWGGSSDNALEGRAYNPFEPKDYSNETASRIDSAVSIFVDQAHELARQTLRERRDALDAIAKALLHEESLDREGLAAIVEAHPSPSESTEREKVPTPIRAGQKTENPT